MDRYRILESVGRGVQRVRTYEDLEIHHPTANRRGLATGRPEDFENPRKRHYARVDGDFEEVRREPDGRVLVKKDFILARDHSGPVHVPAPVSGYVHYLRDATAAVRIYDRPRDQPGAKLLAQSLHMDPASFRIPEGSPVAYGQPLGRMSDTGTPGAIHAHVEAEADQFRRYIRDIVDGTIAPGRWPGRSRINDADTATAVPDRDAGERRGRSAQPEPSAVLEHGDRGPEVRALQSTLNRLGIRDAQGLPLVEDGDFGDRTRDAVAAFQREHGIGVDGRVGRDTRTALAAPHGPRLSDPRHPDYASFEQVLGRVQAAEVARGVAPGPHSLNIAAALLVRMRRDGIERADHVEFNEDARLVRAVQSSPSGLREHALATAPLETARASTRSLHASSDDLSAVAREPAPSTAESARSHAAEPVLSR